MLIKSTELFDISEDINGGHLLYQNTEGKIWIFGLKNIRRSLIIYNPTVFMADYCAPFSYRYH